MRFPTFALLLSVLAAVNVMAVAPQKSVIISYPNDAPWDVVDAAKEAIRDAGGVITHEYNIIKGFSAQAPASALELVTSLSNLYTATIEEDGIVTTQGDNE